MLLCSIDEIENGMVTAAPVLHPSRLDMQLLTTGVVLDSDTAKRLRDLGVEQLWVHHDAMADLDLAISPELIRTRLAIRDQLKMDFTCMASQTVSAADIWTYRRAVMELVCELISNQTIAGLTEMLFDTESELFSHSSNVAYLAVLVGLELESYIVRQRKKVSVENARDVTNLGLGAMLHDIGKATDEENTSDLITRHEALNGNHEDKAVSRAYLRHTHTGYNLLRDSRTPASATQVVLNHHQRYNGSGWPDMAEATNKRQEGTQEGDQIHVYCRIVAAANVLDNLLRHAKGQQHPPVAALSELQSKRFEGWFDPVVLRAMLRRLPPFPLGSQVRLSDGRTAAVVSPNLKQPCRPVVRLLDKPQQVDQSDCYQTLDLEREQELHIECCGGVNVEQWLFEIPHYNPTTPQEVIEEVSIEHTPAPFREDNRREERKQLAVVTHLTLEERIDESTVTSRQIEVTTSDISASGFGFIYTQYLHPGTVVRAEFQGLPDTHVLRGVIRNCLHLGGVQHRIGVEFLDSGTGNPTEQIDDE